MVSFLFFLLVLINFIEQCSTFLEILNLDGLWFQVSLLLIGLVFVLLSVPEHASMNTVFDSTSGRISVLLLKRAGTELL